MVELFGKLTDSHKTYQLSDLKVKTLSLTHFSYFKLLTAVKTASSPPFSLRSYARAKTNKLCKVTIKTRGDWGELRGNSARNRNKQVTHSNTNPAVCSTLRMHSHITLAVAAMDSCFVLVRTHQHGIAPGQVSLTITDPAVYCQGECTSTPLSASSTQHMW